MFLMRTAFPVISERTMRHRKFLLPSNSRNAIKKAQISAVPIEKVYSRRMPQKKFVELKTRKSQSFFFDLEAPGCGVLALLALTADDVDLVGALIAF